ncbi:transposase [Acidimicrobiaceae bacterium USS-CC1]|uniref:Transposase n=1 Tax=Acidiferrimicrobium australe TaxID=2664430 RepID=A0ABW9QN46_9ACTN|nr:transposase [Acidiferrimicrobium australe]
MATDNSHHLHAAQRLHHAQLVERVETVLRNLEKSGAPVSFPAVAEAAGVSRAFIYKTESLRCLVDRLRQVNRATAGPAIPARQRRSEASKDALITRLTQENRALREQNKTLADQNAALLGRLRAGAGGEAGP